MQVEPGMQLVDTAWLSWVASQLDGLAQEIRRQYRREPDAGDLLIVLASAPDTVVGELMSELGLDVDQLAETLEVLRAAHAVRDPYLRIEETRQQKELAKESGQLELSDRLREEERRLTRQLKIDHAAALDQMRIRLGVADHATRAIDAGAEH